MCYFCVNKPGQSGKDFVLAKQGVENWDLQMNSFL